MVSSHVGAHGKDAGLIEGCPQLASATYDTYQLGVTQGKGWGRGMRGRDGEGLSFDVGVCMCVCGGGGGVCYRGLVGGPMS